MSSAGAPARRGGHHRGPEALPEVVEVGGAELVALGPGCTARRGPPRPSHRAGAWPRRWPAAHRLATPRHPAWAAPITPPTAPPGRPARSRRPTRRAPRRRGRSPRRRRVRRCAGPARRTVTTSMPCTSSRNVHGRSTTARWRRRSTVGRHDVGVEVAVGSRRVPQPGAVRRRSGWPSPSPPWVEAPPLLQERRHVEVVVIAPEQILVVDGEEILRRGRSCRRSRSRRPSRPRLGRRALPTVEAGGDDRDLHLVAHLVVDHRAEDDVGVGVGDAVDDLGGGVDLEQAEARTGPVMLSRMPRAPSIAASSSGLEMAAAARR